MSSSSNLWRGVTLAAVPVATLVISYYSLFENKRTNPGNGYSLSLIFGSTLLVGAISGVMFKGLVSTGGISRDSASFLGWTGGLVASFVYLGLLMFLTLNTLGS